MLSMLMWFHSALPPNTEGVIPVCLDQSCRLSRSPWSSHRLHCANCAYVVPAPLTAVTGHRPHESGLARLELPAIPLTLVVASPSSYCQCSLILSAPLCAVAENIYSSDLLHIAFRGCFDISAGVTVMPVHAAVLAPSYRHQHLWAVS